jgi:hypothetical protein
MRPRPAQLSRTTRLIDVVRRRATATNGLAKVKAKTKRRPKPVKVSCPHTLSPRDPPPRGPGRFRFEFYNLELVTSDRGAPKLVGAKGFPAQGSSSFFRLETSRTRLSWRRARQHMSPISGVVLVEVKSGKASLLSRERRCRDAIEAGRVEYHSKTTA